MQDIGCIPASANMTLLGVVFSLLLCSVTGSCQCPSVKLCDNPVDFDVIVIMLAMLYIMFRKYRDLKTSSLVSIIYRDGLVYFVCLSGESLQITSNEDMFNGL
jgi:hypothetical protein